MHNDLTKLLDQYNSEAVNSIAAYHSLLPQGSKKKSEVIETLVKVFSSRQYVQQMLEGLSPAERAFIDAVLRRGGSTSLRNVREELARLGLIDRDGGTSHKTYRTSAGLHIKGSRKLEDILIRLLVLGFVFDADIPQNLYGYQQGKHGLYHIPARVFIPPVIRQYLPQPVELPLPRQTAVQIASVQESSARAFQRDLYLYWSFVRDRLPALTLKGEIDKRMLREVNASLLMHSDLDKTSSENDCPQLRFLRCILTQMALIDVQEDRSLVAAAAPEFFSLPPGERVRLTYESWRDSGAFNELLMLPLQVRPKVNQEAFFPAPASLISARQFVIRQVEKLPENSWVSFKTLVDMVRDLDYEFLFSRSPRLQYSYGHVNPYAFTHNPLGLEFPGVSGEESGWGKVEANLIQDIVRGPLFWMGLVDLGWEGQQNGFPSAFRLTSLGQWLLKNSAQPQIPAEGGRVIIQPNLHIIALDPIQEATLINLDRFAERLAAERAVEYRLTRQSVYHGQQIGWEVPRIKEYLASQTGTELPVNVTRTLDEWQAQYERIRIYPHVAVAYGSPEVIDSLAADPQSRAAITSRPLANLALLKNKQAIPKMVNILYARDILPLVITRAAHEPGSLVALENGNVSLGQPFPDLYLHGHLAAFADPAGEGYRITAASIGRASAAGLTAPEIIERLQAVTSTPLPELLIRRIRAWSRHYGKAALEEVILFQVKDRETLSELLEDPEVGALLEPFYPADRKALARVQSADVAKLRNLLAERGIDLSKHLE
jgi:hypothetical protein